MYFKVKIVLNTIKTNDTNSLYNYVVALFILQLVPVTDKNNDKRNKSK